MGSMSAGGPDSTLIQTEPDAAERAQKSSARTIIETDSLTKEFEGPWRLRGGREPGTLAVDGVSLRLAEGEIFGMVGPNGAGKTTFIRMLSTMVLPTSGTVRVAGYDVTEHEREVRRLVGVVSSNERSFYWRLSGRENLRFFSDLYQLPEQEARPWRDELIELLGLGHVADSRFDHYSTGQKQRMAIARGLLTRPKILLMDEPTKGVDPVGAAEIARLIQDEVLDLGKPTILVTSHNLSEIERLCSRVALMHRGRVVAEGSIKELRARVSVSETYQLSVSGLKAGRLKVIAQDAGGYPSSKSTMRDGLVQFEVSFDRDSVHFSRLVRMIVEAGGDLFSCQKTQATFDDVFHTLIRENERLSEGRA